MITQTTIQKLPGNRDTAIRLITAELDGAKDAAEKHVGRTRNVWKDPKNICVSDIAYAEHQKAIGVQSGLDLALKIVGRWKS